VGRRWSRYHKVPDYPQDTHSFARNKPVSMPYSTPQPCHRFPPTLVTSISRPPHPPVDPLHSLPNRESSLPSKPHPIFSCVCLPNYPRCLAHSVELFSRSAASTLLGFMREECQIPVSQMPFTLLSGSFSCTFSAVVWDYRTNPIHSQVPPPPRPPNLLLPHHSHCDKYNAPRNPKPTPIPSLHKR